jgi:hypothetical protein
LKAGKETDSAFAFVIGFVFGLVLDFLAFQCCGFGHGTYMPLALTSAPFGLFGIPAAFFTAPILWGGMALLAYRSKTRESGYYFLIVIAVHYLMGFVLLRNEEWSDWKYVSYVAERENGIFILVSWAIMFLFGQIALWYLFWRRAPRAMRQSF